MADVYGVQMEDLPDGWQALDAMVIVKCIDASGDPNLSMQRLAMRSSDGVSSWEGVGMLTCYADELRKQFLGSTLDIDDEDP
jgi:hypothetical protein